MKRKIRPWVLIVFFSTLFLFIGISVGAMLDSRNIEQATEVQEIIIEKEIEEPVEPAYYNVPLTKDVQNHIFETCETYNVDPKLVVAIIKTESNFNPDVISKTNDYGLMQINKCNHKWLATELGVCDFTDPFQNITAGVYILSRYVNKYDITKTAMAYNMGEGGASRAWKKGITSTKYSNKVVNNYNSIELKGDESNGE